MVAPLSGGGREVKFRRFDAVTAEMVEIVVGDVVVRVGSDVEPERLAAVIRAVRQVRDGGADPFSGALYVFRSKRADRIKVVWWDGSGVCLFAKTLEETRFCWPKIAPTRVRLNHAQLLALVDGLDWTKVRPVVVKRPQSVG
jgi:transposase